MQNSVVSLSNDLPDTPVNEARALCQDSDTVRACSKRRCVIGLLCAAWAYAYECHEESRWLDLLGSGEVCQGEIMLASADGPIDAGQQAVHFYMHSTVVAGLRQHLLASGLRDCGLYCGAVCPDGDHRIVYEVAHPHYIPGGEIRIVDPDGYVILVGQLKESRPRVTQPEEIHPS